MRFQFSDPFQDTACLDEPRKMPCFSWTKIKSLNPPLNEVLYQRENFRPFSHFLLEEISQEPRIFAEFCHAFSPYMKKRINSHLGGALKKNDGQNRSSFPSRGGNSESLGHQDLTQMQVKVIH